MKDWDMNVVISILLGIMGLFAVLGWIAISYFAGTSSGTEVPLSIASGLSGVLTGKGIAESKLRKELTAPPEPGKDNISESVKQDAK